MNGVAAGATNGVGVATTDVLATAAGERFEQRRRSALEIEGVNTDAQDIKTGCGH